MTETRGTVMHLLRGSVALAVSIAAIVGVRSGPLAMSPAARHCTITDQDGDATKRIFGTPGDDVICGLRGNDIIDGRGGDDRIFGGPGKDRLYGGPGEDRIFGGSERDYASGRGGSDVVRGGTARDELGGKDGGRDRYLGGAGSDLIYATDGPDTLRGGPGGEVCLWAEDHVGDDRIHGGGGTDVYESDLGDYVHAERRSDCIPRDGEA